MKYKINIDKEAIQDIQESTDWYNKRIQGLGTRFQTQVKSQINSLKNNPYLHSNRYADVRCMLIKKFPFMVHYVVDATLFMVEVFAVIHTSRDPKIWEIRRK